MFRSLAGIFLIGLLVNNMVTPGKYLESNRDTRIDETKMEINEVDLSDFELLYTTDLFDFYFKEDRDVVAVYDKTTGYTWKSGLDIEYKNNIYDVCDDASEDEKATLCAPIEKRLNTTFTGIANSFVTVEYYDNTNNIKRVSSASYENAKSTLSKVNESRYVLDVNFTKIRLKLKVYIDFSEDGYTVSVKGDEITGDGTEVLAAILVTPFLGASGGQQEIWNEEEQRYLDVVVKDKVPGYSFVPDGSGALINFRDNNVKKERYLGSVYGEDTSYSQFYYSYEPFVVPLKQPTMPVFGMNHGFDQAAFVSYATGGEENMEIISMPEENMTYYDWTYPRFVYNKLYYQVYNRRGDGYFKLPDEPQLYDFSITYSFLSNQDANYVGMASKYREHLIETGVLTELEDKPETIRLDFLMNDIKNGIFGYKNIEMTTGKDVLNILNEFEGKEFEINLIGWQKGGESLSQPWKISLNKASFSTRDFNELVEYAHENDHDISLIQDYYSINKSQMSINANAVKHINGWHVRQNLYELPIEEMYYAKPTKSVEWIEEQTTLLAKYGLTSHTITGITDNLVGQFNATEKFRTEVKEMYVNTFKEIDGVNLNLETPNQYLLEFASNYLNAPVFNSQHIIETSTVPFTQLVLHNTMGIYADYANFSFNDRNSLLRMIDYNVLPSFVVTENPSYLLMDSMKQDFFSTEYVLYQELIEDMYDEVDAIYSHTWNKNWLNRTVLSPGFILNEYEDGVKVLINYTSEALEYDGKMVAASSAEVRR